MPCCTVPMHWCSSPPIGSENANFPNTFTHLLSLFWNFSLGHEENIFWVNFHLHDYYWCGIFFHFLILRVWYPLLWMDYLYSLFFFLFFWTSVPYWFVWYSGPIFFIYCLFYMLQTFSVPLLLFGSSSWCFMLWAAEISLNTPECCSVYLSIVWRNDLRTN